jgi:hypothetical protein
VEGIRIRRSRRIMKSRRMRTPHLCDEYPFWVPYIFFEVGEGQDDIRYCIRDGIKDYSF